MAEAPQKPSRGRPRASLKRARRANWLYSTIPIAGSIIGIVAAFLLTGWQVVEKGNERYSEERASDRLDTYAKQMNSRLAAAQARTTALAQSSLVRSALATYQPEVIAERSEALTDAIHEAARVEIIARGAAEVDLNADVPISFAALDLIKRAEAQPYVGPEIALNQQKYSYAAAPITLEGAVRGVLFIAFNSAYFFQALNSINETGVIEVRQQFGEGDPASVILQHGAEVEQASGLKVREAPLAVDHWRLHYRPADGPTQAGWISLITPFAVAIALSFGGILIGFTRLFASLQNDAEQLTGFLSRLLRGRGAPVESYRLPTMQQIAQSLASARGASADRSGDPRRREHAAGKTAAKKAAAKTARTAAKGSLQEDTDAADNDEEDFLVVDESEDATANFGIEVSESPAGLDALDPTIFRAYDIRGIVPDTLNEDVAYLVGRAFAAEALTLKQTRVAVGRDARTSSPDLAEALIKGLTDSGMDVSEIGEVPTPLLYYATHALNTGTGIMVTGSHNPPEYNGLKMVMAGETLAEDRIQGLLERVRAQDFSDGSGTVEPIDVTRHYQERVLDDVAIAQPLKVVVDCGNGVAGLVAPDLIEQLGCDVVPLYCDVDSSFPNHHPDPADPKNLEDLKTVVAAENADLGLAFDGDGDRLGVVTNMGTIVWPDKLMMLFAADIVGRNPGADIVYDVKCTRHLNSIISELGGRPIMWKTGHSHIKAHIKKTGALLGGEFSGHICFAERWYGFDDAIYSAARLLEILSAETESAEELFSRYPQTVNTPELKIATSDEGKFEIMGKLKEGGDFGDGAVTTIDGVRVDYEDGWGLIRPSNTSPVLTLRFEADNADALKRIQNLFRQQLASVAPDLTF